jgi:Plasmid pRiA4b ORF-3-like protein
LWRRLELASGLFLDEVHEILQVAFGWTGSHMHQFSSGPRYHGPGTEYYLCPCQVAEGESGAPEEEVRLDEVLADPGDTLSYLYDFGDNWEHVIRLEAVAPWDSTAPAAVCLDGRRDGPPEDCGGLGGYELISAAIDPLNPDHSDAVIEFERIINAGLAKRFPPGARPERADPPGDLPSPLEELLSAVRDGYARRELRWLIGAALAGKPDIDTVTAARMVRPYAWLLDRVGDEGIRLTGAGYLPPAHVEAAATELGLLEDWMGKGNRETQTLPVLHLRETATKMGLLRKHRGMLLLTAAGRKLRTDPVSLWWQLAERMPPRSADRCETQAGLIWLLAVAAQWPGDPAEIVARTLAGIGWALADGTPLSTLDAPGRRGTPVTCCGASAVSRMIPGTTGRDRRTQTERLSPALPCAPGRTQESHPERDTGTGGLPGTAGAEGQQRPDGAVGAAHILLRQPEMVRHAGEGRLPSGPVGDQPDHAGGQDSRRIRGEQPVPDIAETIPRRQGASGDRQAVPVAPGDGQLALDQIKAAERRGGRPDVRAPAPPVEVPEGAVGGHRKRQHLSRLPVPAGDEVAVFGAG